MAIFDIPRPTKLGKRRYKRTQPVKVEPIEIESPTLEIKSARRAAQRMAIAKALGRYHEDRGHTVRPPVKITLPKLKFMGDM